MHISGNNPPTNQLGSGISEADVSSAVSRSGYPLQSIVANLIRGQASSRKGRPFYIQEEWGYVDKDTQDLRTIDILAQEWLYDVESGPERKVRPALNLVVECKQSALPYVFFLSQTRPDVRHFPLIAGLFHEALEIVSDDDPSTWTFDILHSLGLDSHPFLTTEPEYCTTFAKCIRASGNVELSGSEPFNGLILPILKAMQHFQVIETPPKAALYFDCHAVIGIGVLDAPMIGIRASGQHHVPVLLPWVRAIRYETDEILDWHRTKRGLSAIDIVHKDFFKDYLCKHLFPFAEVFSGLAAKHEEELASGKAFAAGFGKDSWLDIEKRLRSRKTGERSKTLVKNLLSIIHRGKPLQS
jgi:hypothetical protein